MLPASALNGLHNHAIDDRADHQVQSYLTYLESHDHRLLLQKFIPYMRGKVILDVGCGSATFFEEIQKAAYPVQKLIGIEMSQILSDKAREKNIPHTEIICASIDAYSLPKDKFDTVTLLSAFHELYSYCSHNKLIETMGSIYRSLHKGGLLLIYDGFQEERQVIMEIKSKKRKKLFERYLIESGYKNAFVPIDNQIFCSLHKALDFIHKSNYVESWEHELPEQYYPLSLETYNLLLEACGFKIILIKEFPEMDEIDELSKEIKLYDSQGNTFLEIPCNCLNVAEKK